MSSSIGQAQMIEQLVDRAEVSELIHIYPRAVDARDWPLLVSIFTDEFEVWMGPEGAPEALQKTPVVAVPATCEALMSHYPVTQHFLSEYSIEIDGDRGRCLCYMQARHHQQPQDGVEPPVWTIGGYYTFYVTRTSDGWRVYRYTLHITWSENPPAGRHVDVLGNLGG